jgi:aminoglycoside 3-N-acetyltransferase
LTLKANNCNVLYVHSSLSFGAPNSELKKEEILASIYEILLLLNVPTICMPTYTFSYCNGDIYDPVTSKSGMGILNEYFRKQPNVIRSMDPLMSIALLGKDIDLAKGISIHSIGKDSTFDKIKNRDDVKFLFLGIPIGECFTYMHYLEWLYNVEYRYERKFTGISHFDDQNFKLEYDLFVRYNGVIPNRNSFIYEQNMYNEGLAQKEIFGNSMISIVEEKKANSFYKYCLDSDPYYFVTFDKGILIKDPTFSFLKKMIAL